MKQVLRGGLDRGAVLMGRSPVLHGLGLEGGGALPGSPRRRAHRWEPCYTHPGALSCAPLITGCSASSHPRVQERKRCFSGLDVPRLSFPAEWSPSCPLAFPSAADGDGGFGAGLGRSSQHTSAEAGCTLLPQMAPLCFVLGPPGHASHRGHTTQLPLLLEGWGATCWAPQLSCVLAPRSGLP